MKKIAITAAIGAVVALLAAYCVQPTSVDPSKPIEISQAEQVKRGEYLVTVMVCDDCHTPKKMTEHGPEPDLSRRLMGHPAEEVYVSDDLKNALIKKEHVGIFSSGLTGVAGPWGVSYAANLTPDDTGTGAWTEAQFIKAIREGRSKGLDGTRPLLPPMPWQQYRHLTDEDLKAIFAYLQSLPPIHNVVPKPLLPTAG
jgi:mono/diheme cytochrome c family protein